MIRTQYHLQGAHRLAGEADIGSFNVMASAEAKLRVEDWFSFPKDTDSNTRSPHTCTPWCTHMLTPNMSSVS